MSDAAQLDIPDSHEGFRRQFLGAAEGRLTDGLPHAVSPIVHYRGDHDLNPGMAVPADPRQAAVLVPIVQRDGHLTVLLTRRSDDLPVHKGQISFPGGRVEEEDGSHIDTALRESEEEIGLDRREVEIVGRLDTYVTRTGYSVTPIVGFLRPPLALTPCPVEVAEIFEVPLSFLLDPANQERHSRTWQGTTRHFFVLPYEHYYIWGATAGMLVNLSDVMHAASQR
ncbi:MULTISPECIES: CoA pyrophosphatase [Thalassobaculum]|uniref:8-oxo-dGTP pyrophosphatase MutT, NUDIX family n=1 Tax=Thalassobaculum litoreum DSM 18839 TaxID=1123362 RepID=A0A8G2EU87_9PROT|nr:MULTISPECIES: CoA pyrophosphatase [Thalassobaculum]SDF23276.1 8-oxo-dGTP pyrophosphatase MutT, NUDIX family [Thalassobaculum litoreum DSM 18839]